MKDCKKPKIKMKIKLDDNLKTSWDLRRVVVIQDSSERQSADAGVKIKIFSIIKHYVHQSHKKYSRKDKIFKNIPPKT